MKKAQELWARDRDKLTDEVADVYLSLLQAMHTVATPALCQMDVSMSQVKAMLTVSMKGEASVGTIARSMGVGQPAASTIVDRLVNLGWVERTEDPADRRRALVRLSGEGKGIVDTIWRLRRDLLVSWLGRMDADDLNGLARGIRALRDASRVDGVDEIGSVA